MSKIKIATIFYASYGICFGMQDVIYGNFIGPLVPLPEWIGSAEMPLAFIFGALFTACSLMIIFDRRAEAGAAFLAIMFLAFVLLLHLPRLIENIYNGGEWTVIGEFVCLAVGGLALRLIGPGASPIAQGPTSVLIGSDVPLSTRGPASMMTDDLAPSKRTIISSIILYVFAASLLIFATLHFVYAGFIATLITAWIPFHLFWAYFIGVAFVAVALSIFTRIRRELALNILGIMFLLWFVLLHLPRVAGNHHNRDEWSSAFIALAMSGISFILADLCVLQPKR